MSTPFQRAAWIGLCAALVLPACGGGDSEAPLPVIVTFTVDRNSLPSGETVNLTWLVQNSVGVTIEQTGVDPVIADDPRTTGTVMSRPVERATTFALVAKNADGKTVRAEQTVNPSGIAIASFTATPSTIMRGESAQLQWRVSGETPTAVVIANSANTNVYQGDEAIGSQSVSPTATETYTIRATGPSGSVESSVTVTVNVVILTPRITMFRPVNAQVSIGQQAQILWATEDATEVQVSQDGAVRRPWTSQSVRSGSVQLPITMPVSNFLLEARNENGETVTAMTTVMGLEVPVIDSFTVTPAEYTQGSTVATASWEVRNAVSVTLFLNGSTVAGFPMTGATGSVMVPVTGEGTFLLRATNPIASTDAMQLVRLGFNEPEPNDDAATAIPIAGDGIPLRGTISSATDVDWYVLMVPEGTRIAATAGYVPASGCALDSVLTLYDSDGATVRGTADEGTDIAPCAEINPLIHGWADGLSAGTYYLAVGSPTGGTYSLSVRLDQTPPLAGLAVTPTRVGNPTWAIGDVHMWTRPIGIGGADIGAALDAMLLPAHAFVTFEFVSAILVPVAPAVRDYSNLLGTALALAGITNSTTFTTAQISEPNGVYFAFTLLPQPGSPTGSSFDFSSGPIIPNTAFPMNANVLVQRAGVDWMAPPDFAFASYPTLGVVGSGDGASHRIFSTITANIVGDATVPLVGSYEFIVGLTDATGAGWTLTVPFVVQ